MCESQIMHVPIIKARCSSKWPVIDWMRQRQINCRLVSEHSVLRKIFSSMYFLSSKIICTLHGKLLAIVKKAVLLMNKEYRKPDKQRVRQCKKLLQTRPAFPTAVAQWGHIRILNLHIDYSAFCLGCWCWTGKAGLGLGLDIPDKQIWARTHQ